MISRFIFPALCGPLAAGTVVITSLPDESQDSGPLTDFHGLLLTADAQIRVGAFPGWDNDAILDAAATGGYAALTEALVPFGFSRSIGEGGEGEAGHFEIAVRHDTSDPGFPSAGEEVSLLIGKNGGDEFLVARFPGRTFETSSETSLEPLLSLHLADAKIIVGHRYGDSAPATSPAPSAGSFATWIAGFPSIEDPDLLLPGADADGDGRSNFLEYATGGNPALPVDPAPCRLFRDGDGAWWVRFSRATGLGTPHFIIETSPDLLSPWQPLEGPALPSPVDGSGWMQVRVPEPFPEKAFFRLRVDP